MALKCEKCGKALKPGELTYRVKIDLMSMYDGYVEEMAKDIDAHLDRLVRAVSQRDPEELAKDVAQTINLVICRACRNELVKAYDPKEARVIH